MRLFTQALKSITIITVYPADDTIAAVCTAAGKAPVATVRTSGRLAFSIAEKLFFLNGKPVVPDTIPGFRAREGIVVCSIGDQCRRCAFPGILYCFKKPRSYTREDVIEIQMPGCPETAGTLLENMIACGARRAEAGEFTARAFFSGRLDLSQAEAVADIVHAESEAALRSGLAALDGRIHQLCEDTANELTEILAAVEASIDLAEEDIQTAPTGLVSARLDGIASHLEDIADSAGSIPDRSWMPRVAMAGRANVGKSSLVNTMTETERTITSSLAGTTRDILSTPLHLDCGATVELLDIAGFLHNDHGDPLLAARAQDASRRATAEADIVVFVLDAAAGDNYGDDIDLLRELRERNPTAPVIVTVNKIDAAEGPGGTVYAAIADAVDAAPAPFSTVETSAMTGAGVDELKRTIAAVLNLKTFRGGAAVGLHDRQRKCLRTAAALIRECVAVVNSANELADSAEKASIDLRSAMGTLGEISGQIVNEDVLGTIFSRFCVGK